MFGRSNLLLGLAACAIGAVGGCGGGGGDTPDAAVSMLPTDCPADSAWSISPLSTGIGGQLQLKATATAATDAPVPLVWKAARGPVASPTAAETTFTCVIGGMQTIVLRPVAVNCLPVAEVAVFCIAPDCGNGQLDPGEQCDPPNGTSCLEGCGRPCGNGLLDPGEQCDPPDGMTCSASCQFVYFDGF